MPQILNIRHLPGFSERRPVIPPSAIYIGRANARYRLPASKWANPFAIRQAPDGCATRAEGTRSRLLVRAAAMPRRCAAGTRQRTIAPRCPDCVALGSRPKSADPVTAAVSASALPVAAASSWRWCGALPRLHVGGDAGEPPAQLNGGRELATLLVDGADRSGIRLGDDEHRCSMGRLGEAGNTLRGGPNLDEP